MWKEESKTVVTLSLDELGDKTQIEKLANEKIIEQKYKFYILGKEPKNHYNLNDINTQIEWEFFNIPKEDEKNFYESIDFGIHIGADMSILKSKANWKIIVSNGKNYTENERHKCDNIKNCYLTYDFNDVKDILTFFAANGLEC